MGLQQVLKKMKISEKKSGSTFTELSKKYPTSKPQTRKGFHAKPNSLKGAARQRSLGNRNEKSG